MGYDLDLESGARKSVDSFYKRVRGEFPLTLHLKRLFILLLLFFASLVLGIAAYFIAIAATYYACRAAMKWNKERRKDNEKGIEMGYSYKHPTRMEAANFIVTRNRKPALESGQRIAESGQDGRCLLKLHKEQNPHLAIIGESGSGKTTFLEAFLIRAYLEYGTPFVIIDWSGSYKHIGELTRIWDVPNSLKVNPMALRGMFPERRCGIAAEVLQFALQMTPLQTQKLHDTIMEFYRKGVEPSIADLSNSLSAQRPIVTKLRQASGVFGDEPELFWKGIFRTCCVVELKDLTTMEKNLVTQAILQRITEEFRGESGIKLYVALDDAHQAIKEFDEMESPVSRIVREGRKFGFGLVISTQLARDLPSAIMGNTALKFLHSYHEPGDIEITHRMMSLSAIEKEILNRAHPGTGFLFDQHAIQLGQGAAFIKVRRLSKPEFNELEARCKASLADLEKENTAAKAVPAQIGEKIAVVDAEEAHMAKEIIAADAVPVALAKGIITADDEHAPIINRSAEQSELQGAGQTVGAADIPKGCNPVGILGLAANVEMHKSIAKPAVHELAQDATRQRLDSVALLKDLDVPSAAVYRFLLCLRETGSYKSACELLKSLGWIIAHSTFYGDRNRPSLRQRAVVSGYVDMYSNALTEKALDVIDADRLVSTQGITAGAEEHKRLMKLTIEMIQRKGNFAFVPRARGSFDVGELEVLGSRWSSKVSVYEAQTNAIPEELEKCKARAAQLATNLVSLTIVTNSEKVKARVEEDFKLKCIVL